MDKRKYIGYQLKRARIPRTQEEVAREIKKFGIHMTQRILSQLERGERDLSAQELDAFCKYFHKPPSYFLEMPTEITEKKEEYLTGREVINVEGLSSKEIKLIEELVNILRESKREKVDSS